MLISYPVCAIVLAPPKHRNRFPFFLEKSLLSASYARVNEEVETDEPLLRVTTGTDPASRQFFRLAGGKRGSLQTAHIMAALVRKAAVHDKQLELFAVNNILVPNGLDSHSDPHEIVDAVYRYCQKFTYAHDPAGSFDSVQSAREVIRDGKGDCDDLSVLLATLLALLGFKPRFVLAKYTQTNEGFDHVYVDLELPRGRLALDPSSRKHGIGWESPRAIERVAYPIFDGKVVGLGDMAGKVKQLFSSLKGLGCESGGCGSGDGPCGGVAPAAGNGSASAALGGVVSLSLPAVLIGIGCVVITLKLVDSFLGGMNGRNSYV